MMTSSTWTAWETIPTTPSGASSKPNSAPPSHRCGAARWTSGEGGAGNSSLVLENDDWADALESLSRRAADLAAGRTSPKDVLFRQLTSDLPSEGIRKFISGSSPVVLSAMSDAVGALMGGLANPAVGAGIVVKADGEKLAALCFQLQMTGYMFRNVEYVLALRELLNLSGQVSGESYKEAFDKIDEDGSGYIESREVMGADGDLLSVRSLPSGSSSSPSATSVLSSTFTSVGALSASSSRQARPCTDARTNGASTYVSNPPSNTGTDVREATVESRWSCAYSRSTISL
mmetsp:Transcript_21345/g.42719  ORF Transcript_21345/g.42719 Transcript_21345/m.42719 type:complete len:289 (+) Transcript_21345:320-1186(+)